MTKKDKVLACLLIAVIFALQFIPASAQGGNVHVYGYRLRPGGYSGIDVYQNTPNPPISVRGTWTGGPNAVTDLAGTFIESGPTKACDWDCGLHPYGSWGTPATGVIAFTDTTVWLGAGLTYRYKSNYIGNNQWQSVFCSGSGCRGMITGNLGLSNMSYVVSGGESSGSGVKWGSITTSHATYKPYGSATRYSWCYGAKWIDITGGSITTCNTSNYSWTSKY